MAKTRNFLTKVKTLARRATEGGHTLRDVELIHDGLGEEYTFASFYCDKCHAQGGYFPCRDEPNRTIMGPIFEVTCEEVTDTIKNNQAFGLAPRDAYLVV